MRNSAATGCAVSIAFIALRCAVATVSFWPPDRKTMPGTAAGTQRRSTADGRLGDLGDARLRRVIGARQHHVGLQEAALEHDPLGMEFAVDGIQRRLGGLGAALDAVIAVHHYLGLDDRNQPGCLRQRRVARQRMGIGVDTTGARDAVADGDHGAPFGEARAQRIVLGATLTQAVEPLGDLLARRAGQRLGAGVDLDAGNDALIGEQQRERRFATRRELAQRLVIEG